MLTNSGGDDSTVFHVFGKLAQLLNDCLWFDKTVWCPFLVCEREPGLPIIDLRKPLGSGYLWLYKRDEGGKVGDDIAFNGFGGFADLVDVFGHNLKMDDSASLR